jgi:tripartite-type tricarboxylate transporter receptor subunit TctC
VLATTGRTRVKTYPDLPTFLELGYEVTDDFSYGVLVKDGTPEPILEKLRSAFEAARSSPRARSKIEALDMQVYEGTAAEYKAELDRQAKVFEADFKKLGIQPQ